MPKSQQEVTAIFESIISDPAACQALYRFYKERILCAHKISPVGWVVYVQDGMIVFSIWHVYCLNTHKGAHGPDANELNVMVQADHLNDQQISQLENLGCTLIDGFKSIAGSRQVVIPATKPNNFVQALSIIGAACDGFIEGLLKPGIHTIRKEKYNPAIIQFLRDALGEIVPEPEYATSPALNSDQPFHWIQNYMNSKGYCFSPLQIASFYTALQTKGFVILSGISGTGKTKLAERFTEMLPHPTEQIVKEPDAVISITLAPDHLKRHRFIIPRQYFTLFNPPASNQRVDLSLTFHSHKQQCWMKYYDYPPRSPYLLFWLQGEAVRWIDENYGVGDQLFLKPKIVDEQLVGLTIMANKSELQGQVAEEEGKNTLFISVRPDWRDSKSLLGYYNPLTKTYEWTDFLRFIVKASNSFKAKDDLAWFVIMDEMNLARVEYYFADLLSVLESGRNENGETTEPLRFQYGTDAEGDLPPAEIYLPPNLYFIGTVNVDETTQTFSPKVLDRAFSLEFVTVNFDTYNLSVMNQSVDRHSGELIKAFTRDGKFACIDKDEIRTFLEQDPAWKDKLQALNTLLQPYNLHFGYRVFDEIMMFLKNAKDNEVFEAAFPMQNGHSINIAFDLAVLMKVLPKFHGSRGKLEKPLAAILAWCADKSIDEEPVKSALNDPSAPIDPPLWVYPATAQRVLRMLHSLYTTGFASFG
jgi:hypothetical protein